MQSCCAISDLSREGWHYVCCVLCRASTDAGSSAATGLAAETIPEDEPEEDVAPTPEQLEVGMCWRVACGQHAMLFVDRQTDTPNLPCQCYALT